MYWGWNPQYGSKMNKYVLFMKQTYDVYIWIYIYIDIPIAYIIYLKNRYHVDENESNSWKMVGVVKGFARKGHIVAPFQLETSLVTDLNWECFKNAIKHSLFASPRICNMYERPTHCLLYLGAGHYIQNQHGRWELRTPFKSEATCSAMGAIPSAAKLASVKSQVKCANGSDLLICSYQK